MCVSLTAVVKECFSNRVLVETNFEASKTLFLMAFGASKIVLTKARLLKHDPRSRLFFNPGKNWQYLEKKVSGTIPTRTKEINRSKRTKEINRDG